MLKKLIDFGLDKMITEYFSESVFYSMGKTGKPENRLKGFTEEWRKLKASPEIQALVR